MDTEQEQNIKLTAEKDSDVSLLDLLGVLLQYKKLIIGISLTAAAGVVIFSILSLVLPTEKSFYPNQFTGRSFMLINETTSASNSLSSALNAGGLTSINSMANIGAVKNTNANLAKFLVSSNEFLDKIINKFNLITVYKIKKDPITNSRKALKKNLKADSNKTASNVFMIECTDTDRVLAQNIVNYATSLLEDRFRTIGIDKNLLQKVNLEKSLKTTEQQIEKYSDDLQKLGLGTAYSQLGLPKVTTEAEQLKRELDVQMGIYKQLRQQYELLKITLSSEKPVFQILEHAELPETKSGPSRAMLCVIVTAAAFFLSVFLAFVLKAVENIKKDPEALKKLKAEKK